MLLGLGISFGMSRTSKSPRKVLLAAWDVGRRSLAAYSHRFSPKKFTQPQLFACLVLKEFFQTDYRGIANILADCPDLRQAIDLQHVPHFTTLQKSAKRLLSIPQVRSLLTTTVNVAIEQRRIPCKIALAAADSTGLESRRCSQYFARRSRVKVGRIDNRSRWQRRFPKLALLCDTRTHFILAAHYEQGPRSDVTNLEPLVHEALWRVRLGTVLADAGYDAEWLHRFCRLDCGVKTLIPTRQSPSPPRAPFRHWMWGHLHHCKNYRQRWQVETTMSMIKRRTGSALEGRSHYARRRLALLKALAHNIMILYASGKIARFLHSNSQLHATTRPI